MHSVESRLRETLSDIPFHFEDGLTRLLADSLSSANMQTDNRLNAVMEQIINEVIAAKLKSSDFRRKIDETVERFVAEPEFMNRVIESTIYSE